jgi:hypothetical protein
VHAARGLRRVWAWIRAWIWACIWAQRGVGVFVGVFGGGQGGDVVGEFLSAAPRPDGIQEAPPQTKRNFAGLRLLYVHESHTCEPTPPLAGIERRNLGLKQEIWLRTS